MLTIVAINCYPRMAAIGGRWLAAGTNSDPMVILSVRELLAIQAAVSLFKHGIVHSRMIYTNLRIHFGSSAFVGIPKQYYRKD